MAVPVKLTRANQVTLPKRLLERAGWLRAGYFLADLEENALVLRPLKATSITPLASLTDLRRHFKRLGITPSDVEDAVAWARQREPSTTPRRRARR